MLVNPRHRARCDRHKTRATIVVCLSCCRVRLSNEGWGPPDEIPQRARSEVLAVVPLHRVALSR